MFSGEAVGILRLLSGLCGCPFKGATVRCAAAGLDDMSPNTPPTSVIVRVLPDNRLYAPVLSCDASDYILCLSMRIDQPNFSNNKLGDGVIRTQSNWPVTTTDGDMKKRSRLSLG